MVIVSHPLFKLFFERNIFFINFLTTHIIKYAHEISKIMFKTCSFKHI